jgi:hypothetical protein
MPPQVTLIYANEEGREARAVVSAWPFQIGRGADNDLVVADTNLSRRHAVIELVGDEVFVSDCGSQNGTAVNGEPVAGSVELRDRDILTLASTHRFEVRIEQSGMSSAPGAAGASQPHAVAGSRGTTAWLSPAFVAPAAAILILIILGIALLAIKRPGRSAGNSNGGDLIESASARRDAPRRGEAASKDGPSSDARETAGARPSASIDASAVAGGGVATSSRAASPDSDDLARDIKRVMSRISNDSAPYISPQGVKDVAEKVRQYRGSSSLRDRLRSMQRACGDVSPLVQKNNLNPTLVMYAAIAESEAGDPAAVARQMLPKLLTLRATFGTTSANDSLILIAAYPYPFDPEIGSRARKSHPLAVKLMQHGGSRSTEETSIARTVWYLREKDAVMPEAYDLVVRLLAIGVVAENPSRFGVDSPPLLC